MIRKLIGLGVFLIGLLVLMIPQWKIAFNDWEHTQQIVRYQEQLETEDFSERIQAIETYNESLVSDAVAFNDPFKSYGEVTEKNKIPLFEQEEIIAIVEIPKIGESLPIYMGANTYHLSQGIAVVEGTSLPMGGINTHSVLAGHRGYSYANFFRNLDELVEGDVFYIHIFGETLRYTIYEKEIIQPNQIEKLAVIPDKDIVTLLTCHPHRSNAQRLLVKGERTEIIVNNQKSADGDEVNGSDVINDIEVVDIEVIEDGKIQENVNRFFDESFIKYHLPNRMIVAVGTILVILNVVAIFRLFLKKNKK